MASSPLGNDATGLRSVENPEAIRCKRPVLCGEDFDLLKVVSRYLFMSAIGAIANDPLLIQNHNETTFGREKSRWLVFVR